MKTLAYWTRIRLTTRSNSLSALSLHDQAPPRYFTSRLIGLCLLLAVFVTYAARPPAAAIASAHPLATRAGHEILAAGGNAFDAAIAVSAALAVAEPTGSGFGGGGFWLLHRAEDGFQVMIDGREQAPQAAQRDSLSLI